jgi:ribosomal protein L7Ae-like RNA K-turn-binding protein
VKNVFGLLGLAKKAGKISSGTMAARTSVDKGRANLLIISNDIAVRTKEILVAACDKRNVPWLVIGNKYELGLAVGKNCRVAVTVNDPGLARSVLNNFEDSMGSELISVGVVQWPK